MTTQMRISAKNDYLGCTNPDGSVFVTVGQVVNVRPDTYSDFEFEDPNNPGEWYCCRADELEEIPAEETLQAQIDSLTEYYDEILDRKDAALTIAAFIFGQYHQLHMAKGTNESTMKALTNLGLERMMLDAIEAG